LSEFDPSHQLAELLSSWVGFMAGTVTFDDKFKVNTQLNL
jgi:hypothetical protein